MPCPNQYANHRNIAHGRLLANTMHQRADRETRTDQAEDHLRYPHLRQRLIGREAEAKATKEELEAPIAATFRRVVSRIPDQAELDRYVAFLKANIAETGDTAGSLRTTLKAIYMSPETIYREE